MARFAGGIGIVTAAWLMGACGRDATLPEGELAPVKIGVVTSLSGGLEGLGPGWLNAALLAEQEANAAGGVLPGRPLELVVADDGTSPDIGRAAAERLIDEGVVAVIGAAASKVTLQVAEVTGPARIPQISCCSTSPLLKDVQPAGDRYLFRTVPDDELQALVLVKAAWERFRCRRLAVMNLDDDYGRPFGDAIVRGFESRGGAIAARVPFQDERARYTTEVANVRMSSPDCIAIVGFPESAGAIVRDWHESGAPEVQWIGTDGVKSDSFVAQAGDPAYVDGFAGTAPREQVGARRDTFVRNYRLAFEADPVIFGASQYDAAALLVLAIARAGSTDGTRIRDALFQVSRPNMEDTDMVIQPGEMLEGIAAVRAGLDVDYDGAGGAVDFDEYGNVRGDYEVWQYDSTTSTFETLETVRAEEIR